MKTVSLATLRAFVLAQSPERPVSFSVLASTSSEFIGDPLVHYCESIGLDFDGCCYDAAWKNSKKVLVIEGEGIAKLFDLFEYGSCNLYMAGRTNYGTLKNQLK